MTSITYSLTKTITVDKYDNGVEYTAHDACVSQAELTKQRKLRLIDDFKSPTISHHAQQKINAHFLLLLRTPHFLSYSILSTVLMTLR